MQGGDQGRALQGIPDGIDAAGPALQRLGKSFGDGVDLVGALEGRVDQDEAALFLRRHVGAERQPAVEGDRLGLDVAGKERLQRRGIGGMQFIGGEPVLRPQQAPRDERRTGIAVF